MGLLELVTQTVDSVGETSVIPLGVAGKIIDTGAAGTGVVDYFTDLPVPGIGPAKTIPSMVTGEPDVSGADAVPMIALGLSILKDMLDQCGTGDIDTGAQFADGAARFRSVGNGLDLLADPPEWSGAASEAYSFATGLQRDGARSMAEIDDRIHSALAAEAEQVKDTRDAVRMYARLLNASVPQAIMLQQTPVYGDQLSWAYQLRVVAMLVPPAQLRFSQMVSAAATFSDQVASAGSDYHPLRGDYDGRPPQVSGEPLGVSPSELVVLSKGQDVVASAVLAAGDLTATVPEAVTTSHGNVCAGTAAALGQAQSARVMAAQWMQAQAQKSSEALAGAAALYSRTDAAQRDELNGQTPP